MNNTVSDVYLLLLLSHSIEEVSSLSDMLTLAFSFFKIPVEVAADVHLLNKWNE